ncbi:MAG: hypothetical protein LC107_12780 [Chitinophagales bacterium]|nr:hypothetical protein [Chitinophagales bacterium]
MNSVDNDCSNWQLNADQLKNSTIKKEFTQPFLQSMKAKNAKVNSFS